MADAAANMAQQAQQTNGGGANNTHSWTLFVGQIPNDVNEDTLKQLFSTYGLVTECKILTDKALQKPRGCGFVTYADKLGAETAIATLHDKYTLPGSARPLIVRYSSKQLASEKSGAEAGPFKLYVSNLSKQTNEAELRAMFSAYGNLVDDVVILKDEQSGLSKGVAFVRYATRGEALHAIQALHEQLRDKDAQHLMQVKFAHTASEKKQLAARAALGQGSLPPHLMHGAPGFFPFNAAFGGAPGAGFPYMAAPAGYPYPMHQGRSQVTKGPEGANLFVYGIPESYDDHDLSQLFAQYGTVINAKVYRDLATGRSKAFGFVSYSDVAPAQAACAAMDGYVLAGKKLTVKPKTDNGQSQNNGGNSSSSQSNGQPNGYHQGNGAAAAAQQQQQHFQQQQFQRQQQHQFFQQQLPQLPQQQNISAQVQPAQSNQPSHPHHKQHPQQAQQQQAEQSKVQQQQSQQPQAQVQRNGAQSNGGSSKQGSFKR